MSRKEIYQMLQRITLLLSISPQDERLHKALITWLECEQHDQSLKDF